MYVYTRAIPLIAPRPMAATNAVPPSVVSAGAIGIAAGGGHRMIMKGDGSVWATGNNRNGQLGDGTTVWKSHFAEVFQGQWGRALVGVDDSCTHR